MKPSKLSQLKKQSQLLIKPSIKEEQQKEDDHDDELDQEKIDFIIQNINTIKLNEAKFHSWFKFVYNEQIDEMKKYSKQNLQEITQKSITYEAKNKELSRQIRELTNYNQGMTTKLLQCQTEFDTITQQLKELEKEKEINKKQIDQFQNQDQEIADRVHILGQKYIYPEKDANKQETDPILLKVFKCFAFVFYDQEPADFNMAEFYEKAFEIAKSEEKEKEKNFLQQGAGFFKKAINVITFDAFSSKKDSPKEADIKIKLSKHNYQSDSMPKDKYEYIKQVYNDEEIKKSNVFKNPIYQLDIVFEWFQLAIKGFELSSANESNMTEHARIQKDIRDKKYLKKTFNYEKLIEQWQIQVDGNNQLLEYLNQFQSSLQDVVDKLNKLKQLYLDQESLGQDDLKQCELYYKLDPFYINDNQAKQSFRNSTIRSE